ncbi:MAG TPA: nitrous oxide reductase family maturation protein NosD [Gemmatimonadaceae bacterium]
MKAASRSSGMLSGLSRLAIGLSALLLAVAFVVPVWRIDLIAPQYPEGLGMLIRINTITGIKPNDLNNINGLNHYIGMKAIMPDAIPVLRIMPIALGVLVVLGIVVAIYGRRWAGWTWLAMIAAGGAAAMGEFYRWSYDYGHNLAPDAIIKVPGMTYQPPLIGTKQLLNFTAASWPSIGGIAAAVAFALALGALLFASRSGKRVSMIAAASLLMPLPSRAQVPDTVIVTPHGPTLAQAIASAKPRSVIVIMPGRYGVTNVTVDKPLTLAGRDFPTLDAQGKGEVLIVTADDVTITGIHFTGTGVSYTQDRASLRVANAGNCNLNGNKFDGTLYGIYLAKVTACRIENNILNASGKTEATSGNGIHLWSARGITIAGNTVSGFRDGIYFEFVHDTKVTANVSETNLRYGLHFMQSDDCSYVNNTFRSNGAGVAVMYTKRVHMTGNSFLNNRGSTAYGLLLKEIEDSRIEGNIFADNTTGLYADGADRIRATRNEFRRNGWGVKVGGSTIDGVFTRNNFIDNTFDVTTSSREPSTKFEGNFWSTYSGYDLDRDGIGDIPHPPVRLFAVILERSPQAIVLMRSILAGVLDAAERAMPALTPELFVDPRPSMRKVG